MKHKAQKKTIVT